MNGRLAVQTDRPTYPVIKAEFGEDPVRYLACDDLYLAYARIRGIDTVALLKEWQRIEAENWGRSAVMKRLNARERELTDESTPEPETTDSRATATDGGSAITYPENSVKESHTIDTTAGSVITINPSSGTDPVSGSVDDPHPDTQGLAAGEVLVLETADRTEYIFPATPDADAPYLMRAIDAEGNNRTDDLIGLTYTEVDRRTEGDHDHLEQCEIDVRAPAQAATGGAE